ncbi:MAG: hypothetical protein LBH62_00030 [Nitrososphaerota archaeon]|jgi:hypothetical protein|nr:hypothetical protein [Nitrososphaerota archaeon]
MKNHKKNGNKITSILLLMSLFLLMTTIPGSSGATTTDRQVHVPLVIDLTYAIAGAQFTFEYSTGLDFVSYEKSSDISSAITTPVVVKSGYTSVGFYNTDNQYTPKNGKLDMGYLVFNCLNNGTQKVTLTEIKLVQVTGNGETRSEFLSPVEIKVTSESSFENSSTNGSGNDESSLLNSAKGSSSNGSGNAVDSSSSNDARDSSTDSDGGVSLIGADENLPVNNSENSMLSVGYWIAIIILLAVVCSASVFIVMKKRVNGK